MSEREFIMQMQPWFGDEEKQSLNEYMESGGFITEFKQTQVFEQLLCEYTGAEHCIVVNNGTISLSLAALASGLVAGDEVIVPNYTMIATANALKMFGIEPVFVDVEPETLCLDIDEVCQAITAKTKAVMLMSANGRYPAVGIEAFETLAMQRDLILLEDAAQSLGSFYPDGRHIGLAGLAGSFSFSASKIISTGQGGCVVTNDATFADKVRKLKDFGRVSGGNDYHETLGLNFKFTDLQACVGIAQMAKLAYRVTRKKVIYQSYKDSLAGIDAVKFFAQDLDHTTPWFIDVLVEQRDDLIAYLERHQVGSRVMYPPINKQPAYNLPGEHEVSNLIGVKGLWLPSAAQLTDTTIDYICDVIRRFYD
ncbi:MAG: aminotransferase [Cellvibrionales bacterium]|nr:aminotransferase [Cellvibrionales bacterium]|tara:strand:+ start:558 stop:1655 length:1098 start_codon:yes stop_codon:yes gene_type:complete